MTKISILAGLNLHHHVYDAIILRDDNLDDLFDGTRLDIKQFYDEVKRTSRTDLDSNFARLMLNNFDIDKVNAMNISNTIKYEVGLYTANLMNNINMRSKTWVKKLFQVFYIRQDIDNHHRPTKDEKQRRNLTTTQTLK